MTKTFRLAALLALVLLAAGLDACRVKRCPLDNCHIRMRHRHPSMMGAGGKGGDAPLVYDPNAGPEASLGPVYRGVPWWQRNKDPKIAQGYKPAYKYKHKDNRPAWSERVVKYKKKKIKDDAKAERKGSRKSKRDPEAEGADPAAPGEETASPDEMSIFDESKPPKESKKERRSRAKKEKAEKRQEAAPPQEETEDTGF